MSERDASISRRQWWRAVQGNEMLRMAGTALLAALFMGYATYVGLRLKATYGMRTEVALLQQKVDEALTEREAAHAQVNTRLDEIERFLFGEVLASLMTTAPQPPSERPTPVQLWQRNRDKELRTRLDTLERLRVQNEQRIEELEREIRDIKRAIR